MARCPWLCATRFPTPSVSRAHPPRRSGTLTWGRQPEHVSKRSRFLSSTGRSRAAPHAYELSTPVALLEVSPQDDASKEEGAPAGSQIVSTRPSPGGTGIDRLPFGSNDVAVQSVLEHMQGMGHLDTDLRSTPMHWVWVSAACASLLALLCRGFVHTTDPASAAWCLTAATAACILSDAGTGFYHFAVDNYGTASTPVFGPQIDAFQGHHRRPWTIANREFANNLHALARPVFMTTCLLFLLPPSAPRDVFSALFLACVMFSQQFHAWAHTPKNRLPALVVSLQDAGVLVPRKMHGAHHRHPFDCNYCIVSGVCNSPLDRLGVFQGIERLVYRATGVAPRSWAPSQPLRVKEHHVPYYEDGRDTVE